MGQLPRQGAQDQGQGHRRQGVHLVHQGGADGGGDDAEGQGQGFPHAAGQAAAEHGAAEAAQDQGGAVGQGSQHGVFLRGRPPAARGGLCMTWRLD